MIQSQGYISRYFTTDIELYKSTPIPNSWGNKEDSYALDSTFKGLIQPVSGSEAISNQREVNTELFVLFCPVDVSINPSDRVNSGGITYLVEQTQGLTAEGISSAKSHQEIIISKPDTDGGDV